MAVRARLCARKLDGCNVASWLVRNDVARNGAIFLGSWGGFSRFGDDDEVWLREDKGPAHPLQNGGIFPYCFVATFEREVLNTHIYRFPCERARNIGYVSCLPPMPLIDYSMP